MLLEVLERLLDQSSDINHVPPQIDQLYELLLAIRLPWLLLPSDDSTELRMLVFENVDVGQDQVEVLHKGFCNFIAFLDELLEKAKRLDADIVVQRPEVVL